MGHLPDLSLILAVITTAASTAQGVEVAGLGPHCRQTGGGPGLIRPSRQTEEGGLGLWEHPQPTPASPAGATCRLQLDACL